MNYLAHLWLAQRDQHSIIGNMMGDFRRHVNGMVLPERVLCGIENHQRVDKFTDNHPVVHRLKDYFSCRRRRYAGIILDMAFDHFLALHWERYCVEPRETFIDYCYSCLSGGMELMPARMQQTVKYMIREDWLGSYKDLSGIDIALNRLSRRIRFENNLAGSVVEVAYNYNPIGEGFRSFFPDLIRHIRGNNRQAGLTR